MNARLRVSWAMATKRAVVPFKGEQLKLELRAACLAEYNAFARMPWDEASERVIRKIARSQGLVESARRTIASMMQLVADAKAIGATEPNGVVDWTLAQVEPAVADAVRRFGEPTSKPPRGAAPSLRSHFVSYVDRPRSWATGEPATDRELAIVSILCGIPEDSGDLPARGADVPAVIDAERRRIASTRKRFGFSATERAHGMYSDLHRVMSSIAHSNKTPAEVEAELEAGLEKTLAEECPTPESRAEMDRAFEQMEASFKRFP